MASLAKERLVVGGQRVLGHVPRLHSPDDLVEVPAHAVEVDDLSELSDAVGHAALTHHACAFRPW